MMYYKIRRKWKTIVLLAGIWLVFLFPIPFLPLWGLPIDSTSLRTMIITTAIVSIPFTLLAIFMNDGSKDRTRINGT